MKCDLWLCKHFWVYEAVALHQHKTCYLCGFSFCYGSAEVVAQDPFDAPLV